MKAFRILRYPLFMLALMLSVRSVSFAQDSKDEAVIKSLIDSQNFAFKAQTALPMGGRTRHLTSDYDLIVTKASVVSYLPYFGRAYSSTPGSPGGLEFTSKEYEYSIKENKKNTGWDIVIKPKDTQVARELFLTVFKSGTANLQVTSNDKQNISFSGYITENKTKK